MQEVGRTRVLRSQVSLRNLTPVFLILGGRKMPSPRSPPILILSPALSTPHFLPFSFSGLSPLRTVIFSLCPFPLFSSCAPPPYSSSIFYSLNIQLRVLELNFHVSWRNTQISLKQSVGNNACSHMPRFIIFYWIGCLALLSKHCLFCWSTLPNYPYHQVYFQSYNFFHRFLFSLEIFFLTIKMIQL